MITMTRCKTQRPINIRMKSQSYLQGDSKKSILRTRWEQTHLLIQDKREVPWRTGREICLIRPTPHNSNSNSRTPRDSRKISHQRKVSMSAIRLRASWTFLLIRMLRIDLMMIRNSSASLVFLWLFAKKRPISSISTCWCMT